jgi:hypothetical protein
MIDEGTKVRVYDEGRRRHYQGVVLYVVRLDERDEPDGWMVELRNGNRGCFDRQHVSEIG